MTLTLPSEQLNGSQILGSGGLHLAAPMNWNGASTISLTGGLEVLHGQTLTLGPQDAAHALAATQLHNHGTVLWNNGAIALTGATTVTIINEADGVWDATSDLVVGSNGAGNLAFNNLGLLRKSAGSGTLQLGGFLAYTNTGTIAVESGSVRIAADGAAGLLTNSGELRVAAGATFLLDRVTLATGSTFTGAGTLQFNGTTTVTGDLTLTLPSEQLNGSQILGSGGLHLAAPMNWNGASTISLTGGLEVLHGQTLTLGPQDAAHALAATQLHNHGTVLWNNGAIALTGATTVTIVNEADGVWDATSDLVVGSNGAGNLAFNNLGLLRKSAGSGTLQLGGFLAYTNTGTIAVESGSVRIAADGAAGLLTNSGELRVAAGATFLLDRVTLATGSTFTGAGTLQFNGTTTVTGDLTLTLPSEQLNGSADSGQWWVAPRCAHELERRQHDQSHRRVRGSARPDADARSAGRDPCARDDDAAESRHCPLEQRRRQLPGRRQRCRGDDQ